MKSEKGITVTSIMIYIIALTVVVILIGRLTTYFYKNVHEVSISTGADAEYTKFNSYFTDEINLEGNTIDLCQKDIIAFSKNETQYRFQNGSIYRNKVKIAKNVETCEFFYDEETKDIYVNMKIRGKYYSSTYTIVK